MHPDLHQERTALIDDMVNTERALAPPVSIDDLTTSRKFLRFEDAEFYVEGVRALATKYNCNLVKAEITGDSGDLSHKNWS